MQNDRAKTFSPPWRNNMKIKDVVGECLIKMGQTDFSNEQNLDAQKTELKNRLLACINIIYREIVSDYLPLVHTESVSFLDGKIASSTLSKQILYPIKIVQGDEKKSFFCGAQEIFCDVTGAAQITYAYMPQTELTFEGEINDMRLTKSALVNGALAEFYFQNKMFDLAKSFDSDFRAQIGLMRYKGRNLVMKTRRWQA